MGDEPKQMYGVPCSSSNITDPLEENKPELGEVYGSSSTQCMKTKSFAGTICESVEESFDEIKSDVTQNESCDSSFSPEEVLTIWKFLLHEIRMKTVSIKGRVIKGGINTNSIGLWIRYKNKFRGSKSVHEYYIFYQENCEKLHTISAIPIKDKIDLYFALNIPVRDSEFRSNLIKMFGAVIEDDGIIRSASEINHWDYVEPAKPETSEYGAPAMNSDPTVFTEKDDGLMWRFILSRVMTVDFPRMASTKEWCMFKRTYENMMGRETQLYCYRYIDVLAPNLYRMPFDIMTKAVLYYGLDLEVPVHFREDLFTRTGAATDKNGKIVGLPNRPLFVALQSRRYHGPVGVTSEVPSTLKSMGTSGFDPAPFSAEEDYDILRFINYKIRVPSGKVIRLLSNAKTSGKELWIEFIKHNVTHRSVYSLSNRFHETLLDNLMTANFDMQTKCEILYAVSKPISEETLKIIQQFAECELSAKKTISYVGNYLFQLGKRIAQPKLPPAAFRRESPRNMQISMGLHRPLASSSSLPPRMPTPYVGVRDRMDQEAVTNMGMLPYRGENTGPNSIGTSNCQPSTSSASANRWVLVKTEKASAPTKAGSYAGISLRDWKLSNPSTTTAPTTAARSSTRTLCLWPVKLLHLPPKQTNEPIRLGDGMKREETSSMTPAVGSKRRAETVYPVKFKMGCPDGSLILEKDVKEEPEELDIVEEKPEPFSEPVKEELMLEFDDASDTSSCFYETTSDPAARLASPIPEKSDQFDDPSDESMLVEVDEIFNKMEDELAVFYEQVRQRSASMTLAKRIPFMRRIEGVTRMLLSNGKEILPPPNKKAKNN